MLNGLIAPPPVTPHRRRLASTVHRTATPDGHRDRAIRLHRAFQATFAIAVRTLVLGVAMGALSTALLAAESKSKTIIFFGDSLTAGYGLDDPATEAYPARIEEKIASAHLPYHVVNAGLSGETTAGGLRRVDWILRQPVDVFVLALGGNDGLRGIEPAVTRDNLQAIVDRVRQKYPAAKILIAGMMIPPSMGQDYARDFAAVYPEIAKRNDAALLPFLLEGVGGSEELNQADRIHPTAKGHAILAETIWRALQPLL